MNLFTCGMLQITGMEHSTGKTGSYVTGDGIMIGTLPFFSCLCPDLFETCCWHKNHDQYKNALTYTANGVFLDR